ncbi:uncharacterized protein [Henckelia pumila]|uniref:uncharacterized protein n=1 Tax=Henckelia pumila TaxID=405737 RepID=UPI003C6EA0C4
MAGRGRGRGRGNVADMTVDQLSQFITQTVQAAMGQNPPPPPVGQPNPMDAVWEEIRRLGRQVGGRPGPIQRESPFARAILDEELPANFKQPTLGEYDRSSDPEEHLGRFENAALLHRYSDAIKCRVFLTTLVSKRYLKTSLNLFNMKQSEVEPLREYVQRFNTAALEVPAATADTLVNSFTQGLRGGEFFRSLVKKPPLTYDELLSRAEKYVNLEDAQRQRRQEGTSGSKPSAKVGAKAEGKTEGGRKRVAEEMNRVKGPYPYVPLSVILEKAMQVCEDRRALVRPRNAEKGPRLPPSDKFCDFYQEYEHITNDCQRLGEEVQRIMYDDPPIRAELTRRANPPRQGRAPQWRNQRNEVRENQGDHHGRAPQNGQGDRVQKIANHPNWGVIHMISGGSTDEDSGRARKAHGRRLENFEVNSQLSCPTDPNISFGRKDLKDVVLPHNDPLLVTLTIANYDVARIFVDTGSSVKIIFKETLDQMKLEGFELDPITTELYGFTGHALQPLGQIVLPLSLGSGEQRVNKMTCFTVVDAPSSFNGILGRPALSDFRAVASTYHQKLKFPSGKEVGVVRGDQKVARLCYVNEVKVDAKRSRREVGMVLIGRAPRVLGQKVFLISEEDHEKVELSPGAQMVKLAADLSSSMRQSLIDCLKENKDVFAWSVSELTGVSADVMVHRLNIFAGAKQLVDSTAGHQYLCFMDAYQGYHQIPLAEEDQDKVSFTTSHGTFCYRVMPFGLKNAGDTYQRLMDRVFASQIGRNVEVYVDDILVKSQDDAGLMTDLRETFATLRSYGIKLNPEKCVFGVRGGKFLGYMVTERGIEANPEKVQAIQSMSHPRNLQEVQRLAGRIAALSRFISRSAHRSLPFFKVLRKAKKFEWDAECGKAFEDLKNYLAELIVLAKAVPGEPLYIYLSALEGAVSSVLIRQEGAAQHHIYFFLHALKGAELRPMGRILTHAEISGRLVKWTTELSEYDIQYEPRAAIKAQALADFLAETKHVEGQGLWKVYVDGSSNSEGCGVGVLLISPQGDEIRLAVRLDFRASNNEAEYEQVNGSYEVKSEKLKEYMKAIEEARGLFDEVMFEQIPRESNEKADVLAKMASSLHNWKNREVVVQVELTPSTELTPLAPEESDWRKELLEYMEKDELPKDPKKAYWLKQRSLRFVMVEGVLYKKSFSGPLLKCLGLKKAHYVLKEIHEGCCGNHLGSYSLARKVLLAGYFWPTILKGVIALVTSCDSCQRHSRLQHQPAALMKGIVATCPFDQWGMDIVGPFPQAPAQKKLLLVAIDYFSKWVEAEALARITEGEVMKFLWKNIVCRFGVPQKIISDNGRQFQGAWVQAWCKEMKIQQHFTSVHYPQSNGQVEVTNRSLVQSLKTRLGKAQGNWVEELPSVLWSYRTTPKIGTGETPFSLVYGNEAVLPAEIGEESARIIFYDEKNGEKRMEDLDFMEEKREAAAIRMKAYKNRVARSYNRWVRRKGFQLLAEGLEGGVGVAWTRMARVVRAKRAQESHKGRAALHVRRLGF